MIKKISFIFIIISAVFLLIYRISFEKNLLNYKFYISANSLYRYFSMDSEYSNIDEFIENLKRIGLDTVFYMPHTLGEFVQKGDIKIVSSSTNTILQIKKTIWKNNLFSFYCFVINVDKDYVYINTPFYFKDIINKPFNYLNINFKNLNKIYLDNMYIKKDIDGFLIDDRDIIYSKEEKKDIIFYKKIERIFQPYKHLKNEKRIIYQYKRAFLERKNNILIIPFFYNLIKNRPYFSLENFIKKINNAIKIKNNKYLLQQINYNWFITFIKMILIFSSSVFLFENKIFSILFALPSIFIDNLLFINNIYLMLFFLISVYYISKYVIKSSLKKTFSFIYFILYIITGILTINAFGSISYILTKEYSIHFITITFVVSFLIIFYNVQRYTKIFDLTKGIRLIDFIFLTALPVFIYIFIIRSYNQSLSNIIEINIRDFLEQLFYIRPRLKEIFFGYPLLFLGIYLYKYDLVKKDIFGYLIFLGSLGFISSLNTILHFQSFLFVAILRIFYGISIGFIIGFAIFYFIKSFYKMKRFII